MEKTYPRKNLTQQNNQTCETDKIQVKQSASLPSKKFLFPHVPTMSQPIRFVPICFAGFRQYYVYVSQSNKIYRTRFIKQLLDSHDYVFSERQIFL